MLDPCRLGEEAHQVLQGWPAQRLVQDILAAPHEPACPLQMGSLVNQRPGFQCADDRNGGCKPTSVSHSSDSWSTRSGSNTISS